jgi:hypothetical protein
MTGYISATISPMPDKALLRAFAILYALEEAKAALDKAIAIAPGSFVPLFRPEEYNHMLEGLRKAAGANDRHSP